MCYPRIRFMKRIRIFPNEVDPDPPRWSLYYGAARPTFCCFWGSPACTDGPSSRTGPADNQFSTKNVIFSDNIMSSIMSTWFHS